MLTKLKNCKNGDRRRREMIGGLLEKSSAITEKASAITEKASTITEKIDAVEKRNTGAMCDLQEQVKALEKTEEAVQACLPPTQGTTSRKGNRCSLAQGGEPSLFVDLCMLS